MGKLRRQAVRDEEVSTGPNPMRLSDVWDHKVSRENDISSDRQATAPTTTGRSGRSETTSRPSTARSRMDHPRAFVVLR